MEKCKKCGHECHCEEIVCYECVNDVCTSCDCVNEQEIDIPISFTKNPG